ncbi:hemin uptake protein HemP [Ensifer oleiphilus]|uniref:hemin uptake protein HemP n=1 Tax=Ensifer oleiphilus TaxID=2742698 RepID=UPI001AEEEDD1|nr:hemin uptake protein HemP [Ensifer oleiphilus]
MREKSRRPPSRDDRTVTADDTDYARLSQPAASAQRVQRVVESRDLFRGENEILISHDGAIYRMKITRQGKLILNK